MIRHVDAKLEYLRSFGVNDFSHSDGSLVEHFLGTHALLAAWGQRPAVCDSGLFHSVYGTEVYNRISIHLTRRNDVRQVIGEEAETLVWLFCVMSRKSLQQNLQPGNRSFSVGQREGDPIAISRQQFIDLIHLLAANDMEQAPRIPARIAGIKIAGLLPFYRELVPPAQILLQEFVDAGFLDCGNVG